MSTFLRTDTIVIFKKLQFSSLENMLQLVDLLALNPIYGVENKWKKYLKLFRLFCTILMILMLIHRISFSTNNLLVLIATTFQLATISSMFVFYLVMVFYKNEFLTLLNWSISLPERQSIFLENSYRAIIWKVRSVTVLAVKFLIFSVVIVGLALNFLLPLYQTVVNKEKFALPFYCHLSFLPADNYPSYVINYVHQLFVTLNTMTWGFLVSCSGFTILIHAWSHLEGIKLLIGHMREGIDACDFVAWLGLISKELSDNKEKLKILCHSIMPLFIYGMEKIIYFSYILFWLAVKVEKGLLPWAVISFSFMIIMFGLVVINEFLLDQFDDLSDVLYDQPWYELSPAERRLLIPTMIQLQRPVVITTGLQDVTLYWYSNIVKAAYSMAIVMEKLISA